MKKILNTVPIFCLVIFSGTTYIVKDAEKELGKFDLEDGAAGEKEIQYKEFLAMNQKPSEEDGKRIVEAKEETATDRGAGFWTVKGRLVDLLHLKPIAGGDIFFESAGTSLKAELSKEGSFSAELPASKNAAWLIKVNPPAGYSEQIFLYPKGELEKVSFEERLRLRTAKYYQHGIRSSTADLEIALFPLALMEEEEKKYQELMTFEAAPPSEDPAEIDEIKKQSVLF